MITKYFIKFTVWIFSFFHRPDPDPILAFYNKPYIHAFFIPEKLKPHSVSAGGVTP
jgi:hypothetical protein